MDWQPWQVIVTLFLLLLPGTLLLDLHPHRERLDSAGRPLRRGWQDRGAPLDRHPGGRGRRPSG
jgi:hypothetical protein